MCSLPPGPRLSYGYGGYYVECDDYNYYFREGFRRGYEDGYYSRNQYGRRSNGKYVILGRGCGYDPHPGGASLRKVSGTERRSRREARAARNIRKASATMAELSRYQVDCTRQSSLRRLMRWTTAAAKFSPR